MLALMYRDILVPIDGSAFSVRALPLATALARQSGAMLHLVLVNDPSSFIPFAAGEVALPVYDAQLIAERQAEDQHILDEAGAGIAASGVRVTTRLLEGTTVEALREYAVAVGADLTVMSTHGRGGFARVRLGSVAGAYLAHANAPVLLVTGSGDQAPAVPSGPLLVTLDGSPLAERALPHAITLASTLGVPVALFGVTVPMAMPMAPIGTELLADPGAMETEVRSREQYLERMLVDCPPGSTMKAVTELVVGRSIIEEATRIGAGAIAMATHGRSGLMRMILGSVADEVVRHSDRPVLLYRPDASAK